MSIVLQAGAIAVRIRRHGPEVFVVRAKKNPEDWIFPKGHVEPGEETPAAATRELLEEGGVIGRVADLVGVSQYAIGTRHVSVAYYLVWYEADGSPTEQREKAWLSFADARTRLTYDDARGFLTAAERLVARALTR